MLSAGRVVKDAPQSRLKAMSPQMSRNSSAFSAYLGVLCVKYTFNAEIATLSRGFVVDYLDLFQRHQPVGDQAVQHR